MKRFAEFCGGVLIAGCLFSAGLAPVTVWAQDEEGGAASFSPEKLLPGLKDLKADGELNIETDEKGEVSQFQMTDNVILVSQDLDLQCDLLIFDAAKKCLIAKSTVSGHRVKVRSKDVKATCLELRSYVEEKRTVLTGSPVVLQKGMTMAGEEITMTQTEKGGNKVKVRGPKMNSTTSGNKSDPFAGIGETPAVDKGEKKPVADEAKPAAEKAAKADSAPKSADDDAKGALAAPAEPKAAAKAEKAADSGSKSGASRKASVSN